jgi:hypothetical protein
MRNKPKEIIQGHFKVSDGVSWLQSGTFSATGDLRRTKMWWGSCRKFVDVLGLEVKGVLVNDLSVFSCKFFPG